jgi:RNA polymerase-binding transcription factor DksA
MDAIQESIDDVLRDSMGGAGDDPADSGSKAYGREQELTLLAATKESMFQTQRALDRIDELTFGTCESCGDPIGKRRLQAFPRALLCVKCKQAQERR